MRFVANGFLVLLFVSLSVVLGATLVGSRFVEVLWAADPPMSPGIGGGPAGHAFWMQATPIVALPALMTLLTTPLVRRAPGLGWRVVSAILFLSVLVWTLVYFVPAGDALASGAIGGARAVGALQAWFTFDAWRMALLFAAWACALRALLVSSRAPATP